MAQGNSTTGLLDFRTNNIGDDVQSFSVLQHLDRVDTLFTREDVDRVAAPTRLVMNNWWMFERYHPTATLRTYAEALVKGRYAVPSPVVDPIFFGFCLGREAMLKHGWSAYLREHGPIGCRDTASVEALNRAGIESYWSGCMTLFAGRRFRRAEPSERDGILIVDLDEQSRTDFVPPAILREARERTNLVPKPAIDQSIRRLSMAGHLLTALSRARLVVTRRLHVAMPCVGLGTPVVVIPDPEKSRARWRFSGFDQVLPIYFKDEPHRAREIDWSNIQPGRVPEAQERSYAKLCERLQVGAELAPAPTTGTNVRIRNPGLNQGPVMLKLEIGARREACPTIDWSATEIELDLEDFAGLDRMDVQIRAQWPSGSEQIGRLSDLRIRP